MRNVVTGDRCLECRKLAVTILSRLLARYGNEVTIIHGGEPGVDQSFSAACQALEVTSEVRLANWHQTGLPTIGQKNHELIKAAPEMVVLLSVTAFVTWVTWPKQLSRYLDRRNLGAVYHQL